MSDTTARDADHVDKHVGSQMLKRRIALGLNQSELAKAIGVSFQQVQKYEAGTNRVSCSRIARIAEALSAPVEWFFPAKGEGPAAPIETAFEAEVMHRLRRFLGSFGEGARFASNIAQGGPLMTIAVLHTGAHVEELASVTPVEVSPFRPDDGDGVVTILKPDGRHLTGDGNADLVAAAEAVAADRSARERAFK